MENELVKSAKSAVKNWWISLLIGLLSVGLGIWCLFAPGSTLIALTVLFVINFLVGGVFEIIFAISNRKMQGWGFTLAGGIIDLLFGIFLFILPPFATTVTLILFVGFWILFRSIWAIGVSVDLQRLGVKGWGWLLALAILGILFAVLFILNPAFGAGYIVAFAAMSFVFYGAFRIYLAFKLKSFRKDVKKVEDFIERIEDEF